LPKITFIGAGSVEFTLNLCNDIFLTPALQDSTIALMDIDARRLEPARGAVQAMVDRRGLPARVHATLDRREAVRDADYVVTTFLVGGLDAFALDIHIPQKYGVEQCVGDTLGPGGVFRGLRTIPVLLELCRDLDDVAPNALLLNYVNPMAALCWAIDAGSGRPHVGLCHSVQSSSEMLARWIDVPYREISFLCAGINHQAFFVEFGRGREDLYPRIRQAAQRPEIYGQEPVRIELLNYFGYFVTESSGHASEYYPYFRKSAQMVADDLVPRFTSPKDYWFRWGQTGGVLQWYLDKTEDAHAKFDQIARGEIEVDAARTHEYGSHIIEAIETNREITINGNVPNRGWLKSLPEGCCVEVPCKVDARGIQPQPVADYPAQLAALNRTNINVQSLIVEAALTRKKDAVYHAVMLDPLTAAVCTLPRIHAMVSEMLAAEARWLPEFT
jgi:alpha-galactosidase